MLDFLAVAKTCLWRILKQYSRWCKRAMFVCLTRLSRVIIAEHVRVLAEMTYTNHGTTYYYCTTTSHGAFQKWDD